MKLNFKALIVASFCAGLLAFGFRSELLADAIGTVVIAITVVVATLVSVIELSGAASDRLWRRLRLRRRARSPFP